MHHIHTTHTWKRGHSLEIQRQGWVSSLLRCHASCRHEELLSPCVTSSSDVSATPCSLTLHPGTTPCRSKRMPGWRQEGGAERGLRHWVSRKGCHFQITLHWSWSNLKHFQMSYTIINTNSIFLKWHPISSVLHAITGIKKWHILWSSQSVNIQSILHGICWIFRIPSTLCLFMPWSQHFSLLSPGLSQFHIINWSCSKRSRKCIL